MNRATVPFESLESRTLMSASIFNATVKLDRLQLRMDFLQLRTDLFADAKTLLTDNKAMRTDHLHQNTVLQPLVAQLRSDATAFRLTLAGDRLNEAANVIADEKIIIGELTQMFHDRKDPTALAADKVQLHTDRVQLQTDMVAGLTQRLTDRQAELMTLVNDEQAIITALPTSGASTQLTTDVSAWVSDKTAAVARITTDLQKISTDRTQLIADLTAENT